MNTKRSTNKMLLALISIIVCIEYTEERNTAKRPTRQLNNGIGFDYDYPDNDGATGFGDNNSFQGGSTGQNFPFLSNTEWQTQQRRPQQPQRQPQQQQRQPQQQQRRPQQQQRQPQQQERPPQPGDELIFSGSRRRPNQSPNPNPSSNNNNNNGNGQFVLINNRPTIATMAPFIDAPTTPTPQFMSCFNSCQTTSEYNPICGSNRQLYFNEQKFNCAQRCGADVQIVRRGSCEGLFPMMRG